MNSQENEDEESSDDSHRYKHVGEDEWDDEDGEGDDQKSLQERVNEERKHGVHLLLIIGEMVENAAGWCHIEEFHGLVNCLCKHSYLQLTLRGANV